MGKGQATVRPVVALPVLERFDPFSHVPNLVGKHSLRRDVLSTTVEQLLSWPASEIEAELEAWEQAAAEPTYLLDPNSTRSIQSWEIAPLLGRALQLVLTAQGLNDAARKRLVTSGAVMSLAQLLESDLPDSLLFNDIAWMVASGKLIDVELSSYGRHFVSLGQYRRSHARVKRVLVRARYAVSGTNLSARPSHLFTPTEALAKYVVSLPR